MNHTQIQMAIDELRRDGKEPINLATGGFLLSPSKEVVDLVQEVQLTHYHYTSSIGDLSVREEFSNLLNKEFSQQLDAQNIAFVFGGTEGVFLTIAALKEVRQWLHFVPGWHTLATILNTLNRSMIKCNLELFSKADLNHENRGIYLNTPVNPTGALIPLELINDCLENTNKPVLLDMVYEGMTSTPMTDYFHTITANALSQIAHSTVVFSLSKLYRLAGLRLGIIVGAKPLIKEIATLKSAMTLNLPLDIQRLIPKLWRLRHQEMNTVSAFLKQRSDYLEDYNQRYNLSLLPSQATHYRLLECGDEVQDLFEYLIQHQIFLAPCEHNDLPRCLRFNLSADLPKLEIFLEILTKRIR
ncbi:MAG: pyridoxal phosphate-dependent aminotransferase [Tatlockia sp.]|nr:pyridoxal phosphate-dependent aminotransferase [Tatlockia sp.]